MDEQSTREGEKNILNIKKNISNNQEEQVIDSQNLPILAFLKTIVYSFSFLKKIPSPSQINFILR